jgi:hypothetical protein
MGRAIEANIECPFFVTYNKTSVTCEGFLPKSHRTKHQFSNYSDCVKHICQVCSVDGGKKCPHYKMVASLYEKETEK